ncbi:hypothetical protein ACVWZ3_000532 [Bradyrhizobium sp. i1.3.6]
MPLTRLPQGRASDGTCSLTEDYQAGPMSAMPLPTVKQNVRKRFWRSETQPVKDSQRGRAAKLDRMRNSHHNTTIMHVGNCPGRYRNQHDGQQERGLHKRKLVRRRRHLRHRPGCADALDQDAEICEQLRKPDASKRWIAQWCWDAVAAGRQGLGRMRHLGSYLASHSAPRRQLEQQLHKYGSHLPWFVSVCDILAYLSFFWGSDCTPAHGPGLSICRLNDRSIFEKNRAAELIVEPCRYNIELLADAIGPTSGCGEVHRAGQHE